MEWSNWLEDLELDLICVPNQAAEGACTVQASDWSVSKCREKEGDNTHLISSLMVGGLTRPILLKKVFYSAGIYRVSNGSCQ